MQGMRRSSLHSFAWSGWT